MELFYQYVQAVRQVCNGDPVPGLYLPLLVGCGLAAALLIVFGLPRQTRSRLAHFPMLGTRIGAFVLVRKLGQGGMGVVYEAQHQQLELRVAIKLLLAAPTDPDAVGRALAEAEALCAVLHPGVVRVSDFGQLPDGPVYLVMEYLHGESLRERLRRLPGPQPIAQALGIARQVAAALAAVHARGVVHRDLTPANLLLVADPELAVLPEQARVKVLDFGIARFSEPRPGAASESELLVGTPRYMSPEQCMATAPVGPKSDVYALGVVLFELLAGVPPYELPDDDTQALLDAHQYQRARPLGSLRAGVPADVERLVSAMLAKNAARRPPMTEVAERLAAAQRDLPESLPAASSAPPASQLPVTRPGTTESRPLPSGRQRLFLPLGLGRRLRQPALRGMVAALLLSSTATAIWYGMHPTDACRRANVSPGMVCIPGGTFQMGSSDAAIAAAYADCQRHFDKCNHEVYQREGPRRQVTLTSFLLAQYEVTNQDFVAWLNHPAHQFTVSHNRQVYDKQTFLLDLYPAHSGIAYNPQGRPDRFSVRSGFARKPVIYVTWAGARAYCRTQGWDLPTEAQWEWAAKQPGRSGSRGFSTEQWPLGSPSPTCDGVVFGRTEDGVCKHLPWGPAVVGTAATDRTAQGVFDLGGNVEEWVRDRFVAPYLDCPQCRDPHVSGSPDSSSSEVYAVRGGSWAEIATALRPSARTKSPADQVNPTLGFRCAASLTQ